MSGEYYSTPQCYTSEKLVRFVIAMPKVLHRRYEYSKTPTVAKLSGGKSNIVGIVYDIGKFLPFKNLCVWTIERFELMATQFHRSTQMASDVLTRCDGIAISTVRRRRVELYFAS